MNLQKLIEEFKKHNINYVKTNENIHNDFDNEHFFEYKSFEFSVFITTNYEAFIDKELLYKKDYSRFKRVNKYDITTSRDVRGFCKMVIGLLSSVLD